jgi:hypothetical protein
MNKSITRHGIILTGLGLLLLAAPGLRSDDGKGWDGKDGKDGKDCWMLERMTKELGLSTDQVAKVKDLDKADKKACDPLKDKLKLDVDSLKVLIDKKADDGDLKPAIAGIKADLLALEGQKANHLDSLAQILTSTQQAKGIVMMCEEMKHGKGPHGKPGHGPKGADKDGGKEKDGDKDKDGDK